MAGQNLTPYLSYVANTALAKGLRVKQHSTAGEVVVAGDEACIGTVLIAALAAGDPVVILDIRAPGTREFVAGGAIAAGDRITSVAGGKVVTGTGGAADYGYAMEAASADGVYFEGTVSPGQ